MRKMLGLALALTSLLVVAPDHAAAQKRGGILKFAVPAVKPGRALDPHVVLTVPDQCFHHVLS